jgi:hypothetical protein
MLLDYRYVLRLEVPSSFEKPACGESVHVISRSRYPYYDSLGHCFPVQTMLQLQMAVVELSRSNLFSAFILLLLSATHIEAANLTEVTDNSGMSSSS